MEAQERKCKTEEASSVAHLGEVFTRQGLSVIMHGTLQNPFGFCRSVFCRNLQDKRCEICKKGQQKSKSLRALYAL